MPETGPALTARSSPLLLAAAAVVALLLVGTLALWAHYGTAVFYEMIVAGLAGHLVADEPARRLEVEQLNLRLQQ